MQYRERKIMEEFTLPDTHEFVRVQATIGMRQKIHMH